MKNINSYLILPPVNTPLIVMMGCQRIKEDAVSNVAYLSFMFRLSLATVLVALLHVLLLPFQASKKC
jgi:hypothetical protein